MCLTNDQTSGQKERKRVIVSGAGPAGVLCASLLLNKNKSASSKIIYDVVLLDGRDDYGVFTKEELSKNYRSWMIGLADHGLDAIKKIPSLYNDFVKGEGILAEYFAIYVGSKKLVTRADAFEVALKAKAKSPEEATSAAEAFIVDRNFIVAAMAKYIKSAHENDPNYKAMYKTTCQYVDYANKRVLVRDVETKQEHYIDYDLLIGCDGVRSTVREAMVKRHSDFSVEYTDIFQEFKQTHLKTPKNVSKDTVSVLPDCFPYFQGIVLPETDGQMNLSMGVPRSNFDKIDDELKSNDYKVVAEYAKKNLKAFELEDYEEFGRQWVNQRWNQTGMVHCNFYHSMETGIVLMGDAAHATSPSIGMGMNTALRDAQVFSEILEETEDDFEKALPAFSKARVKEGNALSDLAMHLYCMNKTQQLIETIHQVVRNFFFLRFPRYVLEHPATMVGRRGVDLSECYEQAVKLGIMRKHRGINDLIRLEYFEQETGMIQTSNKSGSGIVSKLLFGAVITAIFALAHERIQSTWY